MPSSMFLKSHCAWTHTVWIRLLIEISSHDGWRHSMCLATYHNCSWSCRSFAVDHTYMLQLRDVIGHITLEKCFNLKHCYFIEWHHWCHRPDQCSSSCLTSWNKKVGQDCWTSSSTFIYSQYSVILRWCCQIERLLHLRQQLSSTTIHDYIFNINIHPSITTSTTVLL